eukprot:scaffold90992_cov20-Tisochrysis_lutea.AAC.2
MADLLARTTRLLQVALDMQFQENEQHVSKLNFRPDYFEGFSQALLLHFAEDDTFLDMLFTISEHLCQFSSDMPCWVHALIIGSGYPSGVS